MLKMIFCSVLVLVALTSAQAFVGGRCCQTPSTSSPLVTSSTATTTASLSTSRTCLSAAPADRVHILETDEDVYEAIHHIVLNAAKDALLEKGHFRLAIPGGSVLKCLSTLEADWKLQSHTTVAFVNHKCVDVTDISASIEAQARDKFLTKWGLGGDHILSLTGSGDAAFEAEQYEALLRQVPEGDIAAKLVQDEDGYPIFDLMLVGVGDDGHIGSLYPNRDEINVEDRWVVPVDMKDPPSISMTLPLMQRAKRTVILAAGQSEKYPKGKADAMYKAIADKSVTPQDFPASALREHAVWILDQANASELEGFSLSNIHKAIDDACADPYSDFRRARGWFMEQDKKGLMQAAE